MHKFPWITFRTQCLMSMFWRMCFCWQLLLAHLAYHQQLQAKENESKYTGVSADDARMGKGFGSASGHSSSDFGSRSGPGGFFSGSIASKGFGSDSGNLRGPRDKYDDDFDVGHHSLKMDDSDKEEVGC